MAYTLVTASTTKNLQTEHWIAWHGIVIRLARRNIRAKAFQLEAEQKKLSMNLALEKTRTAQYKERYRKQEKNPTTKGREISKKEGTWKIKGLYDSKGLKATTTQLAKAVEEALDGLASDIVSLYECA